MKTFGIALRTLLRMLRDAEYRDRVTSLDHAPAPIESAPTEPPPPSRSDALTLLALLQREGRLVDFLQEPVDDYTDAQIGAAVREVHKASAAVLDRAFGLAPLRDEAEGDAIPVPAGFDPAEFKLSGKVISDPPYQGVLRHHGWRATRCELPTWTGTDRAALVVAPAEVEVT